MLEYYEGQKLSIFISKNDKYEGIVLYELLLEIAFNSRLSGGTVTIGDKGFYGDQDESTKLKVLRSSENLPVVLEFQGRTDRIVRYIERVQPMIKEGLFTVADVQIIKFNSPNEEADTLEDKKNQDQSKIFDQDDDVSSDSERLKESADTPFEDVEPDSSISDTELSGEETLEDVESDGLSSDTEETVADFSEPEMDESINAEAPEPDENETMDEDLVENAEPTIDNPTFEVSENDQEAVPEVEVEEPLEPHIEENSAAEAEDEEDDTPGFQSLDDDDFRDEGDEAIEEEDEEDDVVLQLADFSQTTDEENEGDNLDPHDLDETAEDTFSDTEFSEPKTDDELDALFEESSEKFESTFDDMLKQAGKTTVESPTSEPEEEKSESNEPVAESPPQKSDDLADESGAVKSSSGDKNHNEEEMKNYFSTLFKK